MAHSIILEKFQGPLDLLLQLIEQEKLDISEIAIAKVIEQYFAYLSKMEEKQPDELADFLVIATKLVYLKSKYLLPFLYPEPDEGPSLAEQLKLYKRYAQASKVVEKLWSRGLVAYGRAEPPPARSPEFALPGNASVMNLQSAMILLLRRLKPLAALPQVTIDHSVSVKHKIEAIYAKVKELHRLSFGDIWRAASSKTEIIVSFLALLELVKQQRVSIIQSVAFEDMVIRRV